MVVCTDCGLSSYENRKNDHTSERAFITVQSLKKMKGYLQEWSLSADGWSIAGTDKTYDLDEVDATEYHDSLFYKERWINENGLEQRIIATFSFKYKEYLNHIRSRQIDRAEHIIKSGRAGKVKKSPNDAKRFIKQECCTMDGEIAQIASYGLNQEMIDQERPFRRILRHRHRSGRRCPCNHKGKWREMDNRERVQDNEDRL